MLKALHSISKIGFLSGLLILTLSCNSHSQEEPLDTFQPTASGEAEGPIANEVIDGETSDPEEFYMDSQTARELADYIQGFLKAGHYEGQIADERACTVNVKISHSDRAQLSIDMNIYNDEGEIEDRLKFHFNAEGPFEIFQAHHSKIRLSVEIAEATMTPRGMQPMVSLLWVKYDNQGPVAITVFQQANSPRKLSIATCSI